LPLGEAGSPGSSATTFSEVIRRILLSRRMRARSPSEKPRGLPCAEASTSCATVSGRPACLRIAWNAAVSISASGRRGGVSSSRIASKP
jgi:hypothetical protein